MAPDYLVAMEDFTITALAGLGLQPEYTALPLDWYRPLSERAVAFARATAAGAYGPCGGALPFAGLHGIDYDTARQAGRLAGEAGVAGIATGLAGALADRSFTDFRVQDGAPEPLAEAVPRPYLRALDVAAGLHAGTRRRRAGGRASTRSARDRRSWCRCSRCSATRARTPRSTARRRSSTPTRRRPSRSTCASRRR